MLYANTDPILGNVENKGKRKLKLKTKREKNFLLLGLKKKSEEKIKYEEKG